MHSIYCTKCTFVYAFSWYNKFNIIWKVSSCGIGLDDASCGLATLRLLEFCLSGYLKALVPDVYFGATVQRECIAETCRWIRIFRYVLEDCDS